MHNIHVLALTKQMAYRGAYSLGLAGLSARLFGHFYALHVKMFFSHQVIDRTNPNFEFLSALDNLALDEFERRLRYIRKRYAVISMDEYADYLRSGRKPRSLAIVLTFDDGYESMYTNLFPLLKAYRTPVTIFLTTGCVDNKAVLWHDRLLYMLGKSRVTAFEFPDGSGRHYQLSSMQERAQAFADINPRLKYVPDHERTRMTDRLAEILQMSSADTANIACMMTWPQVREMHASGLVTFGAHTVTHPILTRIEPQQSLWEIRESKKVLESALGVPVKYFAYPNGQPEDINGHIKAQVKEAGYSLAFTTSQFTANTYDPFEIPRYGLEREPFHMFALRTAGFFDLLHAFRARHS